MDTVNKLVKKRFTAEVYEAWMSDKFQDELSHALTSKTQRRTVKKDPNRPKKPLSAYFKFCNAERIKVKQEEGRHITASELGKRWTWLKEHNPEELEVYRNPDSIVPTKL